MSTTSNTTLKPCARFPSTRRMNAVLIMLTIGWQQVAIGLGPTALTLALTGLVFIGRWLLQIRSDMRRVLAHLERLNGSVTELKASDSEQNQRLSHIEGLLDQPRGGNHKPLGAS